MASSGGWGRGSHFSLQAVCVLAGQNSEIVYTAQPQRLERAVRKSSNKAPEGEVGGTGGKHKIGEEGNPQVLS